MNDVLKDIRTRLTEYRVHKKDSNTETSIHINALEMAVNLAEYSIEKNRKIQVSEYCWFKADWELIHVLENSEWEDLLDLYFSLKKNLVSKNLMDFVD